jgi:putative ABC transport system permease protein
VTAVLNATVMPASLSLPILGIAVLVSILVGVVAGVAPAYRGARLDPIEALRHE